MTESLNPRVIIILSGKRKSGKDYVAALLDQLLDNKVFLRISVPIKKQYSQMKGLDFKESLTDSPYKESFRQDMIRWSEEVRRTDPNIFLRSSIEDEGARKYPIWVLVDARRPCDLEYMIEEYGKKDATCKLFIVRIVASQETRGKRGWTFQSGVDDVDSECALDSWSDWTLVIPNEFDTTDEDLKRHLSPVLSACQELESAK